MTGGPRPVPGLSNGHGYDVMKCVIVMTSCEYQTLNGSIFYNYYIYFERKGVVHRSAPVRHLVITIDYEGGWMIIDYEGGQESRNLNYII